MTTTVRTICDCGHEGGHQCPLDWSQAARSVRRNAAIWAAAYRAAADEIQAEADSLNIPGSPASPDAIRGMTHAAEHLRARADEMEQQ